ncbi:hypothetical protein [Enterobacter hormaechei]|nr:hypothetical protein [Enterobacter hormaechei]MEC6096361.1 hypothetical protein [Enterobacter hormaechei]
MSQFLSQGYTFLDEVLVNAETQTVLEGGNVSAGQTGQLGISQLAVISAL